MKTVHEVSRLTGLSIRALRYYDRIGLLKPSAHTEAGYRLYDDACLKRLSRILLFRELEFSLKEIKDILDSPDFDEQKALNQQITLLTMKKEHIENLILLAKEIKISGVGYMDFTAFDRSEIDKYAKQAKKQWGDSREYQEYTEKSKGRTKEQDLALSKGLMELFRELGEIKTLSPDSEAAAELIKRLQAFITESFYTCTDDVLLSLGKMYAGGGEFTENIDRAGGKGTAEFACRAIEAYVKKS